MQPGESLESKSCAACPATRAYRKKREELALLDVNEDFIKDLFGRDLASSHTTHYIKPFIHANPIPCCQCGQAVHLLLKESECPKKCYRNFTI